MHCNRFRGDRPGRGQDPTVHRGVAFGRAWRLDGGLAASVAAARHRLEGHAHNAPSQ